MLTKDYNKLRYKYRLTCNRVVGKKPRPKGRPTLSKADRKAIVKARNNPNKVDPSRTGMLRRRLERELKKKFSTLKARILKLIVDGDAFGLSGLRTNSLAYYHYQAVINCGGPGSGVPGPCPSGVSNEDVAKAKETVEAFEKAVQTFGGPGDESLLTEVKAVSQASKVAAKVLYEGLKERYGKTAAIAIVASAQVIGWGAFGVGLATGIPLYLPGVSVWGSVPATAVAETVMQVSRGAKAVKEKITGKPSPKESTLPAGVMPSRSPVTAGSSIFSQSTNATEDVGISPARIKVEAMKFRDEMEKSFLKYMKENADKIEEAASKSKTDPATPVPITVPLAPKAKEEMVDNPFCATGPGGGVDPTCGRGDGESTGGSGADDVDESADIEDVADEGSETTADEEKKMKEEEEEVARAEKEEAEAGKITKEDTVLIESSMTKSEQREMKKHIEKVTDDYVEANIGAYDPAGDITPDDYKEAAAETEWDSSSVYMKAAEVTDSLPDDQMEKYGEVVDKWGKESNTDGPAGIEELKGKVAEADPNPPDKLVKALDRMKGKAEKDIERHIEKRKKELVKEKKEELENEFDPTPHEEAYVSKFYDDHKDEDRFSKPVVNTPTNSPTINPFCPTGQGGGVDATCGKGGGSVSTDDLKDTSSPARKSMDKKIEEAHQSSACSVTGGKGKCGEVSVALWDKLGQPNNLIPVGVSLTKDTDTPGRDHVVLMDKNTGVIVDPTSYQYDKPTYTTKEESGFSDFQPLPKSEMDESRREAVRARRQAGELSLGDYRAEMARIDNTYPVVNANEWLNRTNSEKIKAFQLWLQQQLRGELIGRSDEELWERYIQEGLRKGAARAFDDVKKPALAVARQEGLEFYTGTREQFLRSSFLQPVAVEKVKLLTSRAFTELEGISVDMATRMTRSLTDSLVQGKGAREVARSLLDVVDMEQARAATIARTEIVRAHAEGQLVAMKDMGVEEVGVAVEWSTAGDDAVCDLCSPMEGVVLKLDEAQGMLPRHPNCRCAWIPANVGESTEDQERSKRDIDVAIGKSIDRGEDEWGLETEISKSRPESILNTTNYKDIDRLDKLDRFITKGVVE